MLDAIKPVHLNLRSTNVQLKLFQLTQGCPEFMVQTLMVGTGHCNNHLLYRNEWAQVRRKQGKQQMNGKIFFFLLKASLTSVMFTVTVQNCVHQ